MRVPVLAAVLAFALPAPGWSQAPPPPHLALPLLKEAPSMARDADLSTWAGALTVSDFGMSMPDDKGVNRWPTTAHLAFGPDALYVAFEAEDPQPAQVRAHLHRRDDFSGDMDFVGVDLDPSGKGLSCLRLLATPLGGQFDAIVTDNDGENYSYDCLWESVGVLTDRGYVVKIRVPYASLRRRPGEWGLRFLRIIPRERRYGIVWPKMSRDIPCDLCQMAHVSGAPVARAASPFMLIPFATYTREQDLTTDPSAPVDSRARLGLDLRYASPSVTLEGTYRPDFATADADVDPLQVNSRFRVFYPERRPFFLEGMELLGITGAQRQFFSRSVEEPQYGIKASGQSAWGSWTVLHAKDNLGGAVVDLNGGTGGDSHATRDTAAAVRFGLDARGSGLTVLGTDDHLLDGPSDAGGQSGGLYLDKYFLGNFHFIGSGVSSVVHLPQADGTVSSERGTATALRLDWNTRHWFASASAQATSPELILLNGFTDLQGYRQQNANFGWQANWNQGAFSQANASLRWRKFEWWNGDPFDRAVSFSGYLETAGRWAWSLDWDIAGRTWANDEVTSNATRNLNAAMSWKRLTWAQMFLRYTTGRTIDLDSGVPAQLKSLYLESSGAVHNLTYDVVARRVDLDREADGLRLVRARELSASAAWQFPHNLYVKTQAFAVRYDGSELEEVDKFLKAFIGWQPNAFTQAYIGWSGQRHRDPTAILPTERMVDRGLFAKFAYAVQF
ncbi:MAG TPA: DUF5916 domain-containing protein [Holophagaceae bacterium]|nr:DUF5916 domain-containing protein [Holophagaceae bacterium]